MAKPGPTVGVKYGGPDRKPKSVSPNKGRRHPASRSKRWPELTNAQERVLVAYGDLYRETGYPPTYRQVMARLFLASTGTLGAHVEVLLRLGYLHKPGDGKRIIPTQKAGWDELGLPELRAALAEANAEIERLRGQLADVANG